MYKVPEFSFYFFNCSVIFECLATIISDYPEVILTLYTSNLLKLDVTLRYKLLKYASLVYVVVLISEFLKGNMLSQNDIMFQSLLILHWI